MRRSWSGLVLSALIAIILTDQASAGQQTIYWKKDHVYAGPGGPEIAIVTPLTADQTAPTAPGSLAATTVTATSVALSWTSSTDTGGSGLAGYKIYRQRGSGANVPVGTVGTGVLAFTDQPLQPSTSYSYTVVAFDKDQNHSAASNVVPVTTSAASTDNQAPGAPLNLRARISNTVDAVVLNWLAATDAGGSGLGGYKVQRGGSVIATVGPGQLSYQDNSVSQNSTYTYAVYAFDNATPTPLNSPLSNSVTITVVEQIPPTIPENLVATALSDTTIRITWSAATDSGGSGLAGYKVYRSGELISGSNPITSPTFDSTGLSPNTSYSFTVAAVDGAGNNSNDSWPVSATTLRTVLFQDDFNRGAYQSGLGTSWQTVAGCWSIYNNTAAPSCNGGNTNYSDAYATAAGTISGTFRVTVDVLTSTTSGITLGGGWRVYRSGSVLAIDGGANGYYWYTTVGTAPITLSLDGYATTNAATSWFYVYVNGSLIYTFGGWSSTYAGVTGTFGIYGVNTSSLGNGALDNFKLER